MSSRTSRLASLTSAVLLGCSAAPPPEPSSTGAAAAPAPTPAPLTPSPPAGLKAPAARKVPHEVKLVNGKTLIDDYAWLKNKGAPEVLDHLKAENAYTDAMTAHLAPLRDKLYQEMLGYVVEDDVDVPFRDGAWLYYSRVEKGKQYPIHFRKPVKGGDAAKEETLLDLNDLAKDQQYVGIGLFETSDDGNVLAYGLDTTGFRQYVLQFKDLRTGKLLPERIERVTSAVFAKDNRTVFYVVEDPTTKRAHRLYRHALGTDPAKDTLLHEEADARFGVYLTRSMSRALIFVSISSWMTSEVRFLRADKPAGPMVTIAPREQGHDYSADHRGQELLIVTDSPATPGGPKSMNSRLVTAPLDRPDRASWKEVIPPREGVMLEKVEAFAGFTVATEREAGVRHLRFFPGKSLAMAASHRVALPEAAYSLWNRPDFAFDTRTYRFGYESPVTPQTIYEYDPAAKKLDINKREQIPGGFDPARYEVKRVFATAKDGVKVPITLAARKGVTADGKNPVLLWGYGSYGHPLFPSFSSMRLTLLDRGVIFAIAHLRGGGDLGEAWHEDGRMMKKMNTFTDFIAAAEALTAQGWADPKRLVIEGRSAGGLLMGAVINMRPDLFAGVVSEVPFVDVINTMLDETLPATVSEFEEWGNPKKPDELSYILRYSPYENITAKAYPPVLVRTSYNDSQVMYWEPAKYVAKLRAMRTDPNPVLLKILLDPAGHGGMSGRYDRLRDTAFTYAWALERLGVK
ncbi:S9 family peptidase [Chondromyces apiculatus]|uniref:Protease II n=1 Tax=Chondromyces apiculatus DSM 436 TaxID=1192034 RepID=A0A017SWW0_9BACT|nr:S9 family peptidase [Chondromyces apiculatus]EYF01055.1 Protease II [Chondromyces apiculatus DSM 436]